MSEGCWHGTGIHQGFGTLQDEALGYLGWVIGMESKIRRWMDSIVARMVTTKERLWTPLG